MPDYPDSKTTPWSHQIDVWNKSYNHKAYYYALDMGCGKSKAAVDYANGIKANSVIVICPKKVIPVWEKQFWLHSATQYKIFMCQKGNTDKKARDMFKFITQCRKFQHPYVVVINYESFWREKIGPVKGTKKPGVLLNFAWDLMICDEAHRIKSPGGKASWMAAKLAKKSNHRRFLSGTPMPHSPLDLYAQFRALEPSLYGTSFARFRSRYCIMGGFEGRQVVDYQNLDELSSKFFTLAHHVSADDALDLPDQSDYDLKVDLKPKTMKLYNTLEKEFIADVEGGIISVQNALDKLLRLSQIAGGYLVYEEEDPEDESKTLKQDKIIDDSKIDLLMETIEDLPPSENIVIFVRFINEIDRITKALQKKFPGTAANKYKDGRYVCEISGRVSQPMDFEGGKWKAETTNVCIAQIKAGGEGIDLTAARYCFYFSIGYSLGEYMQSRARTRRPGQNRKLFYYHILARQTVDEKIKKAIIDKKSIVESVLDQVGRPTSKGELLSEKIFNQQDFLKGN